MKTLHELASDKVCTIESVIDNLAGAINDRALETVQFALLLKPGEPDYETMVIPDSAFGEPIRGINRRITLSVQDVSGTDCSPSAANIELTQLTIAYGQQKETTICVPDVAHIEPPDMAAGIRNYAPMFFSSDESYTTPRELAQGVLATPVDESVRYAGDVIDALDTMHQLVSAAYAEKTGDQLRGTVAKALAVVSRHDDLAARTSNELDREEFQLVVGVVKGFVDVPEKSD